MNKVKRKKYRQKKDNPVVNINKFIITKYTIWLPVKILKTCLIKNMNTNLNTHIQQIINKHFNVSLPFSILMVYSIGTYTL